MSSKPIIGPTIDLILLHPLTGLQAKSLEVWMASVSSVVEKRRPNSRRSQRDFNHARDRRELLMLQLDLWCEDATDEFATELAQLKSAIQADTHEYWELKVTNGLQFDGERITSAQRQYGLRWQGYEPGHWQDDTGLRELQQMMDVLSALPTQQISLTAFEDKPEDHRLLAWMAADLWQLVGGWIAVPMRKRLFTLEGRSNWSTEDSRALLARCGGHWHEIHAGKRPYYLLDGDAIRDWGYHPDCYMGS